MNITKNKIFKNHKKALLLVAAVLCQICALPFIPGFNNNTQFSIKAALTNQQRNDLISLYKHTDKVVAQGLLRLLSLDEKMVYLWGLALTNYNNMVRAVLGIDHNVSLINTNSNATKAGARLLGFNNGVFTDTLDNKKMVKPVLGIYVLVNALSKIRELVNADNDFTAQALANVNEGEIRDLTSKLKDASASIQNGQSQGFVDHMKLVATALAQQIKAIKLVRNNADVDIEGILDNVIEPLKLVMSKSEAAATAGAAGVRGSQLYRDVVSFLNEIKAAISRADQNRVVNILTKDMLYVQGNGNANPDEANIAEVAGATPSDFVNTANLNQFQNVVNPTLSPAGHPSPIRMIKDMKDVLVYGLMRIFSGPDDGGADRIFPVLNSFAVLNAPGAPGGVQDFVRFSYDPGVTPLTSNRDVFGSQLGASNSYSVVANPPQDANRYYNGSFSKSGYCVFADLRDGIPIMRLFATFMKQDPAGGNAQSADNQLTYFSSYKNSVFDNDDLENGLNRVMFSGMTGRLRLRGTAQSVIEPDSECYPLFSICWRRSYSSRVQNNASYASIFKYNNLGPGGFVGIGQSNDYNSLFVGSQQTASLKTVADSLRTSINTSSTNLYNSLRGGGDEEFTPQELQTAKTNIDNATDRTLEFWKQADTYKKAKQLADQFPNDFDNSNYFKLVDNIVSNNTYFDHDATDSWKIVAIRANQDQAVKNVWNGLNEAKRRALKVFGPDVFSNAQDWPLVPGQPLPPQGPIPQQYQTAHARIQAHQNELEKQIAFWDEAANNYDFARQLATHYPEYDTTDYLKVADAVITRFNMGINQQTGEITDSGTITVADFQQLSDPIRKCLRCRGANDLFNQTDFPEPTPAQRITGVHNRIRSLTNNDEKSKEYWRLSAADRQLLNSTFPGVYDSASDTLNLFENFLKAERDAGYIVPDATQPNKWNLVQSHANTLKGLWDGWSQAKKRAAEFFAPDVFTHPPFRVPGPGGPPVPYTPGKYANLALSPSQYNALSASEKASVMTDTTYGLRFKGPEYTDYDPNNVLNDVDLYKVPLSTLRAYTGDRAAKLEEVHPIYGKFLSYYKNNSDTQATSDFGSVGSRLRELCVLPQSFRNAKSSLTSARLNKLYEYNINFRFPPYVAENDVDFSGIAQSDLELILARRPILGYSVSFKNTLETKIKRMKEDAEDRRYRYGGSYGSGSGNIDLWSSDNRRRGESIAGAECGITGYMGDKVTRVSKEEFVKRDVSEALVKALVSGNSIDRLKCVDISSQDVIASSADQKLQMRFASSIMFAFFMMKSNINSEKAREVVKYIYETAKKLISDSGSSSALSGSSGAIDSILSVLKRFSDGEFNNSRSDLDKLRNTVAIIGTRVLFGFNPKFLQDVLNGGLTGADGANKVELIQKTLGEINKAIPSFWADFKTYVLDKNNSDHIMDKDSAGNPKYGFSEWGDMKPIIREVLDGVEAVHKNIVNRFVTVVTEVVRNTTDSSVRKVLSTTSFADNAQVSGYQTLLSFLQNNYANFDTIYKNISGGDFSLSSNFGSSNSGSLESVSGGIQSVVAGFKEAIGALRDYLRQVGGEVERYINAKRDSRDGSATLSSNSLTTGTNDIVKFVECLARSLKGYLKILGSEFLSQIPVKGLEAISQDLNDIAVLVNTNSRIGEYLINNSYSNLNLLSLDLSNYIDTSSTTSFSDGIYMDAIGAKRRRIVEILEAIDKDRANAQKADPQGNVQDVRPVRDSMLKVCDFIIKSFALYRFLGDALRPLYNVVNVDIFGDKARKDSIKQLGYEWDNKKTPMENLVNLTLNYVKEASASSYYLSGSFHLRDGDLKNNAAFQFLNKFSSLQEDALKLKERRNKEDEAQSKAEEVKAELEDKEREEREEREAAEIKAQEKKEKEKKVKEKKKKREKEEKEKEEAVLEAAKEAEESKQKQVLQAKPQMPVNPVVNYTVPGFDIYSANVCTMANIQYNPQTRDVTVVVNGLATDGEVFMDFFPDGVVDQDQKRMSEKTGPHSAKGTYNIRNGNVKSLEVHVYGRNGSGNGLGEEAKNFQTRIIIPLYQSDAADVNLQVPEIKDGASNPIPGDSFIESIVKSANGGYLIMLNSRLFDPSNPSRIKNSGGVPVDISSLFGVIVPDNGSEKAKFTVALDSNTSKYMLYISAANAAAMGIGSATFSIHLYGQTQTADKFVAKFDVNPSAIIQPKPQAQQEKQAQAVEEPAKEVEDKVLEGKASSSKTNKKAEPVDEEDEPDAESEEEDIADEETDDEGTIEEPKKSKVAEADKSSALDEALQKIDSDANKKDDTSNIDFI